MAKHISTVFHATCVVPRVFNTATGVTCASDQRTARSMTVANSFSMVVENQKDERSQLNVNATDEIMVAFCF